MQAEREANWVGAASAAPERYVPRYDPLADHHCTYTLGAACAARCVCDTPILIITLSRGGTSDDDRA